MTYAAKIILDSISPDNVRLTTFEVTFPRIVLAEFNTHRVFSRNSASSRAIPVEKMLKMVQENPYIPEEWGTNQRGMQAAEALLGSEALMAEEHWLRARDLMVQQAQALLNLNVHKQLTNRLLEPFLWHTVIVTSTEWSNFFHLRDNKMAHPAIKTPAEMMRKLHVNGTPRQLPYGEWHDPYVDDETAREVLHGVNFMEDAAWIDLKKISSARSARVSYLTHDGKRDLSKDFELHDGLMGNGHMSPFEHPARPATVSDVVKLFEGKSGVSVTDRLDVNPAEHFFGNFRGWVQYRKEIPFEDDILGAPSGGHS